MKKLVLIVFAAVLAVGLFAGCKKGGESGAALKPDTSLPALVQSITDEIGMPMPGDVDDETLKNLFYLEPSDVKSYSGKFSVVNVSAANIMIVEAKDDTVEKVQEALNKRKTDVESSFEMYLPDQYKIAQDGKVVTKGNYVALLIIEDLDKAESMFNEAFEG